MGQKKTIGGHANWNNFYLIVISYDYRQWNKDWVGELRMGEKGIEQRERERGERWMVGVRWLYHNFFYYWPYDCRQLTATVMTVADFITLSTDHTISMTLGLVLAINLNHKYQ